MSTQSPVQQSSRQLDRQEKPVEALVKPEPARSNGSEKKFAEPQSWALKWDGFALAEFETTELRGLK